VAVQADPGDKLYAFWYAEGVPKDGKAEEEDSGLAIRRAFTNPDGTAADPEALVQGNLYHVRLSVTSARAIDNLVIADLLPSGLEIEDPNLRGAARIAGEKDTWHDRPGWRRLRPDRVERRDDRLIAFADFRGDKGEFRYAVRAVTAGEFVLPAVEASCMYDPGLYSVHGRGTVRIRKQEARSKKPE
jgi:uncharacterized protein YfaS (alpha-2-macroglobulin family)